MCQFDFCGRLSSSSIRNIERWLLTLYQHQKRCANQKGFFCSRFHFVPIWFKRNTEAKKKTKTKKKYRNEHLLLFHFYACLLVFVRWLSWEADTIIAIRKCFERMGFNTQRVAPWQRYVEGKSHAESEKSSTSFSPVCPFVGNFFSSMCVHTISFRNGFRSQNVSVHPDHFVDACWQRYRHQHPILS